MVARTLEQKDALNRVLRSNRKSEPLALNWQTIDVLEAVHKAFSSLSKLTDALSGRDTILYY